METSDFISLPFALTASIGTIYHRIDMVMLSAMQGDAAVGWYNAACNLVYTLVIIPDMFSYAVFPVMSRFFVSSKEALKTTLQKSAKYLFILGLPIGVGTSLLSDRIILLIYGAEFTPAIVAMQVLALYLPRGLLITPVASLFRQSIKNLSELFALLLRQGQT